ncbi:MAG: PD-(D/E)XK nuclease family transposase, partial [Clostridia bacterium]|nr:PD-(D/E)XK nuclease family transposase [Clostridia bacterium]
MDLNAKRLLSYEAVLAMLMRMCIPEFAGFSAEYIVANCFADKPFVSSWPVHQDEGGKLDSTRRVTMMNSEDSAVNERTIHYDIRFTARVPRTDPEADESLIRLIINVEIQVDDDLAYSVVTRGIYYCARMISAQYGTVFTHQEYQKLQKVYSIWICPDSTVKQNTITEYRMQEFQKLGNLSVKDTDYDKLQVIMITIGPEGTKSENALIRFLSLLLKNELPL